MHRIDTATATPDHKFTEGDPTIPVAATTVSAEWLNAVQEELVAVITGAGLELKKSDNGQLWQAISQLITNAKPGLATKAKPGLVQVGGGLQRQAGRRIRSRQRGGFGRPERVIVRQGQQTEGFHGPVGAAGGVVLLAHLLWRCGCSWRRPRQGEAAPRRPNKTV